MSCEMSVSLVNGSDGGPHCQRTQSVRLGRRTVGTFREDGWMLFGRDEELDRIDEALGEARLVTLTGPGGVGKSALALAVAESSPVHALIVELASLGPSDLAESIAGSLGFVSFPELTQHLADGGTLLVVDNCEHILDAAADFVERLLSDCPDLSILATSRERFGLASETVIPVQPLPFEGADSPAVAMFTDAAMRSGSMDLDPATVGSLVGRLDGLPLAIELAAARSSSIDPAVMLEHLDARIDLISRSRRRGLNRHRSLEAAAISATTALLAGTGHLELALCYRATVRPTREVLGLATPLEEGGGAESGVVIDGVVVHLAGTGFEVEPLGHFPNLLAWTREP